MPQAPVITENIIKLIAEIYSTDKTLVAKQVLDKVHEALGRSDWPKLSVIQRELKKIRDKDITINPAEEIGLDSLWHLGVLAKYPLPPEGIAKVVEIKCLYGRPPKHQKGAWGISLSIREAIWISRLSLLRFKVPTDLQLQQLVDSAKGGDTTEPQKRLVILRIWDFDQEDDPAERERKSIAVLIWDFAHDYAAAERISELSGIPFDSYDLDEEIYELLEYPKPIRLEAKNERSHSPKVKG